MDGQEFALACEQVLAESVADVATELRLVNVIDLIGYVRAERVANLEDIVNSSAELYFRHGALRYAWSADVEVAWDAPPCVSLNMEFHWTGVTAFFRLRLDAALAGVEILYLALESAGSDNRERLRLFDLSLAEARLLPPRRRAEGRSLKPARL
jgi:hypothetical protein